MCSYVRRLIIVYLNEVICVQFNKQKICKDVGCDKDTNKMCKTLGLCDSGEPLPTLGLKGQLSKEVTTTTQEGKLHGQGFLRGTMAGKRRLQPINSHLVYFQNICFLSSSPQQGPPTGLHNQPADTRGPAVQPPQAQKWEMGEK